MQQPEDSVHLHHPSGAEAEVWVHYGANLNRLRLLADGRKLDVVQPTEPPAVPAPWGKLHGVPVLFPFPGRVKGATYRARGKTYSGLPVNDPDLPGNHIHGLVAMLPWTLLERSDERCTSRITDADLPAQWRTAYPFPFDLSLTHSLGPDRLEIRIAVTNPGGSPLPFGFGLHPYFSLPFAGPGTRAGATLEIPASKVWPQHDYMPVGTVETVPPGQDLRRPGRVGDLHGDPPNTVYGLGQEDLKAPVATLRDPSSHARLDMRLRGDWRALVLFRPPEGPAVCVEPQTCVPNAVNLQDAEGDTGWLELPAGETWTGMVELSVSLEGNQAT